MQELYGNDFSASASSAINKGLDATLVKFARRPLEELYPYLIVDTRYKKVRGSEIIRSQAVLIALRPMARSTNRRMGNQLTGDDHRTAESCEEIPNPMFEIGIPASAVRRDNLGTFF